MEVTAKDVRRIQKLLQRVYDQEPVLARVFHRKKIRFMIDDHITISPRELAFGAQLFRETDSRIIWLLKHEGWHCVLNHHERFYLIQSDLFERMRRLYPRATLPRVYQRVRMTWNHAADLEANQLQQERGALPCWAVGRGMLSALPKGHTAEYYARRLCARKYLKLMGAL